MKHVVFFLTVVIIVTGCEKDSLFLKRHIEGTYLCKLHRYDWQIGVTSQSFDSVDKVAVIKGPEPGQIKVLGFIGILEEDHTTTSATFKLNIHRGSTLIFYPESDSIFFSYTEGGIAANTTYTYTGYKILKKVIR